MDTVTNSVYYSLAIGSVLPGIISVIIKPSWSTRLQAVVAFVICLLASAGVVYATGETGGKDFVAVLAIVVTVTQSMYRAVWRPTGVSPAIEHATSGGVK